MQVNGKMQMIFSDLDLNGILTCGKPTFFLLRVFIPIPSGIRNVTNIRIPSVDSYLKRKVWFSLSD